MLQIDMYQSHPVEVVTLTNENGPEVALWCDGELQENGKIEVRVGNRRFPRKNVAKIGYKVVKENAGTFRVFSPKSFDRIFVKLNQPTLPIDEVIIVNQHPKIDWITNANS